ncbi:EthD family reductase [Umezawaea sp. Da 62-37]|uniref:EthD family reductase n=1 Tax=Umezawaea sp. Da 62-37 TaxID=3075927 RepID=UPI0028F7030A|nr:EthD family reductase [Umezawaea sp. Da 62-37]WNV82171.1 EthD family reductase [Umezawaea sp. Da 62-37]
MIKCIALYKTPADVADFDEKYFATHLPIVEKTPGLLRAEVAKVDRVLVPGFLGDTGLHVIAEMYFESAAVMKAAFQSPEWHAAGANLSEIGGLELVAMFTAEVVAQ